MAITEAETLGQQSSFKYESIKKKNPYYSMESILIKHAYAITLERLISKMIQKLFETLKKVETKKR